MLVQSTEDEGATSERPSEPQPTPSPPHPSEANVKPQSDPSPRPSPTPHIPDSIPEVSGGNHGGQSSSDKSLSGNRADASAYIASKWEGQIRPFRPPTNNTSRSRGATCHALIGQPPPETWCHVACQPSLEQPPDHRSTVVNDDGQRRSIAADHRRTTARPPPDHRSTVVDGLSTGGPGQVLGRVRSGIEPGQVGHGLGQVGSWAGSSRVMGQVGSPRVSCHVSRWDPLADMSVHVAATCR
ncbi:hypothetical protein Tco_0534376 [Tanacetum coccineum]